MYGKYRVVKNDRWTAGYTATPLAPTVPNARWRDGLIMYRQSDPLFPMWAGWRMLTWCEKVSDFLISISTSTHECQNKLSQRSIDWLKNYLHPRPEGPVFKSCLACYDAAFRRILRLLYKTGGRLGIRWIILLMVVNIHLSDRHGLLLLVGGNNH